MSSIASQIASLANVYSIVYSGADQSKHQSSASLAFVWGIHRGPVNSPHKGPVTRKMFPFDDVIMNITPNSGFSCNSPLRFVCYPWQHTLRTGSTNYLLARGFIIARLISIKFITNQVHFSISMREWFHCDLSNMPTLDQRFETNPIH